MSASEFLCRMMGPLPFKLTKEENLFLEVELFIRIQKELKQIFKIQYKNYFDLDKLSSEMENTMLEENFIRFVINDILLTEEYTLQGIAYYTQTPEEVI